MARMIFICKKCNSTYGANSGTHNICPDCKMPLIETCITSDYWRTLSTSQKDQVRLQLFQMEQEKHMDFCCYCGNELFKEAVICPNCGSPVKNIAEQERSNPHQREQAKHLEFCRHCGNELFKEAVICPNCGCPVKHVIEVDESISAFMVILSVLSPIVGLIYWPVKSKTRPKSALTCGIVAIISWLTGFPSFIMGFIEGLLSVLFS